MGEERAIAQIRMTQRQHTCDMAAMDIVDGDGREFKVKVKWPNGYIGCPVVVAFVDRTTSKTVGWAAGKSENTDVTETALIHMCETNYCPRKAVFDHGSAFNSQRIAGGQTPAYRTKQTKAADWVKRNRPEHQLAGCAADRGCVRLGAPHTIGCHDRVRRAQVHLEQC